MGKKSGSRKFNGKKYNLVGSSSTKSKARKRSDYIKRDFNRRIVKTKKGYDIYARRK